MLFVSQFNLPVTAMVLCADSNEFDPVFKWQFHSSSNFQDSPTRENYTTHIYATLHCAPIPFSLRQGEMWAGNPKILVHSIESNNIRTRTCLTLVCDEPSFE